MGLHFVRHGSPQGSWARTQNRWKSRLAVHRHPPVHGRAWSQGAAPTRTTLPDCAHCLTNVRGRHRAREPGGEPAEFLACQERSHLWSADQEVGPGKRRLPPGTSLSGPTVRPFWVSFSFPSLPLLLLLELFQFWIDRRTGRGERRKKHALPRSDLLSKSDRVRPPHQPIRPSPR